MVQTALVYLDLFAIIHLTFLYSMCWQEFHHLVSERREGTSTHSVLLILSELTRQVHLFHSLLLRLWKSSVLVGVRTHVHFMMTKVRKLNSQSALPCSGAGMGLEWDVLANASGGGANILGQRILITTLEPSTSDADVTVEQFSYKLKE